LIFSFAGLWPRTIVAFFDKTAMKWTAVGAFFGPFIGVSLSLVAVQATHAGVAATLMSLTPVLIVPAAAITQRRPISTSAFAAACLAVAGSALLFF
jgi:drug/metabolite transporter (DMT)-like permease